VPWFASVVDGEAVAIGFTDAWWVVAVRHVEEDDVVKWAG
jgi:hypothetical protein